jgi:class 3 adenylate cyclase/tetratricopeptide (TPR) repeat protein
MLPSLRRYLPEALYEPLERRPTEGELEAVRDHLTALLTTTKTYLPRPVVLAPQPAGEPQGGMYRGTFLFGDVSGFTPLSERLKQLGQLGAERITDIINDLFSSLVGVLFDHGGTLLKFGGDALLGLFPAESEAELEDSALRAVQAALAMQAAMEPFSAIEAAGETRALRIKCGISSGPYFAAHLGTPQSMAYVTTGHTVNRADQAEGHAEPGDVVIAQPTRDLLGDGVTLEPRAEGFFVVRQAPPVGAGGTRPPLEEPPPGDVPAQLTYLVERLDRLTPYLAAELLPRIVTNPGDVRISPDHRPVTVMFANYVGVSKLIDDLGARHPALITRHLNDYFVHMAQVVERYEGTLARMDQYSVGDRLVIFFGAPRAHEDDPVRAVYTALDMQAATRAHFSALQTPEGIYRFRQRVGINTGHLFAGNAGAPDLRQEYTLMGDDINMAARLMSQAGWQEIYVSRKTQERAAAFFELEDLGSLKVKGKEILIPTFKVLGRREEVGEVRGLEGRRTPLIGRGEALATLRQRMQSLLGGRGQVVSVIGDSGLGKTRLVREARRWLEDQEPEQDVLWLTGQALSFSEQVSYWLAIHLMRGLLDLPAGASADDALFTLWERGEELLGRETAKQAVPFLAYLMRLDLEGEWARVVEDLDPQVRQKQTFWAARELFTAVARQRQVIVVLDDLHWADESSLALVQNLMQVTDRAPVMLCLIFRPRRDKGCWQVRDYAASNFPHRYTELSLGPLFPPESRALLEALLPGAQFSASAEQEILDKSAGNPFYLEEVVSALVETEAVVPDPEQPERWQVTARIEEIAVPDTLQSAIVARIDRLTEDARHALQMAAVIGRRFRLELLRNLAEAEQQLDAWLAQLERNGLIQPAGVAQEADYTFLDALVQEVAYESLLVQRRQQFHYRVGLSLEKLFAGALEEQCELLAYHFSRSDDDARAVKYLGMAGRKAQANFANETAIEYYRQLLERLGTDEAHWRERWEVLSRRQQVYGLVGRQEDRRADLEALMALAQAHADDVQDGEALSTLALRSDALNALADLHQWTGRYEEAVETAQEALTLSERREDVAGQATALHTLGVVHYYQGDYAEARPRLERAVEMWRQQEDGQSEAWSRMYLGMIELMRGNYGRALTYHRQALEVARARQDWFQEGIHLTNCARVSLRLGAYEQALEQFERSLEMKTRVGDRMGQGFALFGMGLARVYLGRYDEAAEALRASLQLRREIDDERGVGYSLHGLGLVALGRRAYAQAEEYFQQAHEVRAKLGLQAEVIADLSYLAQARLGLGRLEQALEASRRAMALVEEQRDVEEVQQVYLNHYRVLAALGDAEAESSLRRAHEAMMAQAERIADPERRERFLSDVVANREIQACLDGAC